jgi:hypothetical protein
MNNKSVRTIGIVLLLSAIGICAAVTFLPAKESSAAEKGWFSMPLPDKMLSGVPLYEQPTNETCGQASFVMAWNYTHPDKPLNVDGVVGTATKNGWYIYRDAAKVFTSPDHMGDMATYYAGHNDAPNPEVGHILDETQAMLFLYYQLTQNHPVIVDVNTDMGNTESSTHFVVVTGVSFADSEIYYNDPYGYIAPAVHEADQEHADWTIFWNSWRNNGDDNGDGNGWYMIVK